MPVFQNIGEDQKDIPAMGLGSYKKEQDKLTDDLRRQARQAYNASISFMDAQLGATLDALDRLGLTETTVVVFTSDHGYHVGEHGLWQKQSLFEESARVPLIIAGPGVPNPGKVAAAPVAMIDIFPTLAELCGVAAPGNLQGQSLVPLLKDPTAVGRGWALSQVVRGGGKQDFGYSLRTPRWRYTEWAGGKAGRELYDHENDPRELTNLAEDPTSKATLDELSGKLAEAVKSTFPKSGKPPVVRDGLWPPRLGGTAGD
jgi:iduronate 2-sulfatase